MALGLVRMDAIVERLDGISAETVRMELLPRRFCFPKSEQLVTSRERFVPGMIRGHFFVVNSHEKGW